MFPTLAEYLGALGYATAGFVGNTFYCSYDSGLNRGFTHYEDYVLDSLAALRTVHLVDLSLKALAQVIPWLGRVFLDKLTLTAAGILDAPVLLRGSQERGDGES